MKNPGRFFFATPSRALRLRGWFFRPRLRPPRRLQPTREGRWFIAITIGIGLAAVNTGNNLLYLLLGWLLSTIVASGALSDLVLRGIRIGRRSPATVHAGRPFHMEIEVDNDKRRMASFALEIGDLEAGRAVDKSVFFLKVPAGGRQRASYRHTLHRRGVVRFDGFRVSTRFPFGLFTKSRALAAASEIVVFPALRKVALPAPRGRRPGDAPAHQLGRRGEFFALREYREGDDRRSIHWKSSARAGELLVREVEQESQRRAAIFLDSALDPASGEAGEAALEEAISLAASLAVAYLAAGFVVRVVSRGAVLGPHAGRGDEHRLLRALAVLSAAAPGTPFAGRPATGEDCVVVAADGAADADWPADAERARAA
jgi:uncharacterized protein (DUF58 family)